MKICKNSNNRKVISIKLKENIKNVKKIASRKYKRNKHGDFQRSFFVFNDHDTTK